MQRKRSSASASAPTEESGQRPQMPYRPPRRQRLGGGRDGIGIDPVVPIEIRDRTRLAEMLDAERTHAVAVHGAEPGERRGMAVENGDDAAVVRHALEQALDVRARMHEAALARAL